jgi:hypothetical protein
VVYATTGTAPGEGHLQVQNLTMPGVAGLDGSRTYTAAEGHASVASQDSGNAGVGPGPRVDTVTFPRATWRHVRMQGIAGHPQYGYSLYALEVRDGEGVADLAQGSAATGSSADTGKGPELAVDGNGTTRWAVAVAQRTQPDSWLAVDLGADRSFDRVTLRWETAAGSAYRVQGSADGQTWTDLVRFPEADLTSTGGWLSVDGRAGLVVRGAANPLSVYGDLVVLSDGPAEPLLIEGLPSGDSKSLAAAARQPAPSTAHAAVAASTAGGHLSLFNLSGSAVTTAVSVPQDRSRLTLFAGAQVVTADGTDYTAVLDAASAQVAAARFAVRPAAGGSVPTGVRAEVVDAATVRLGGPRTRLILTTPDGRAVTADIRPGRTTEVTVPHTTPYPLPDAAIGRDTFPSAPLPPGMSDPAAAVDGNPATSWLPGPGGRMVVDLGAPTALSEIRTEWTGSRVPDASIALSTDGLAYQDAGTLRGYGRTASLTTTATARYVALTVSTRRISDARLTTLTVTPA